MSIKDNSLPQNRKDFALVDVFFHRVILRPAYLVQLLIHQFDHMKMIEDMHGVRAVFKYRGDKSCREISGDILDVELLPSAPFSGIRPKHRPPCPDPHGESDRSGGQRQWSCTHALFGRQTRLYRCCPLSQERAATLKSVNLFDRVPRHAQKMGCVFEGHSLSRD